MGAKFQVGDRVRIHEELFPSFNEGLFNSLAKTGTVGAVEPDSILPYQVKMDGFEHHPFWFYENQLDFEDSAKEAAWQEANRPKPRPPAAAPTAKPAAARGAGGTA